MSELGLCGWMRPEVLQKIHQQNKDEKKGIHGISKEDRVKFGSKGGSQKWRSIHDGYISNAGGVAVHNKSKGWDPNDRERVDKDRLTRVKS